MRMNKLEFFLMNFDLGRHVYLRDIVRKLLGISQLPPGKKYWELAAAMVWAVNIFWNYLSQKNL